jgi:undecaprenyl-phosphate galactose phosphotransferase
MRHQVFETREFRVRDDARQRAVRYRDGAKRIMDVGLSLALVPMVAPVVGALALLVRLDGGPAFFGHERVGRDGRGFRCWKIRTMVPDAQQRLRRHLAQNPAAMREWQQNYKLADDPRVTRLGRFLRKTSLDELPQLWNVLRGDMSLVGPRPVPREELEAYAGSERAYFLYRPGVTGLWQVSGRNAVAYEDRVRMDMDYSMRACARLDLLILLRTGLVVLRRTGL